MQAAPVADDDEERGHGHEVDPHGCKCCTGCTWLLFLQIFVVIALTLIILLQLIQLSIWNTIQVTIVDVGGRGAVFIDEARGKILEPVSKDFDKWLHTVNQTMKTVDSFTDSGPTNVRYQVYDTIHRANKISTRFDEEMEQWIEKIDMLLDAATALTADDVTDIKIHALDILHQIQVGNVTRIMQDVNRIFKLFVSATSGLAAGLANEIDGR